MLFVCCFFYLHHPDSVPWVLNLISMHHSMMLLLFLQNHCLLIWWEWKSVDCWWMHCVMFFFFEFTIQIELRECCVWFQCITHWFCSFSSNLIPCHSFFIHFFLFSLFLPHFPDSVISMWCSLSVFHSLILLLQLQSHCLSFFLLSLSLSLLSFLSSSLPRFIYVNVVFTFSISLIAFAPSSPIWLSVIHSFAFFFVFFFILTL